MSNPASTAETVTGALAVAGATDYVAQSVTGVPRRGSARRGAGDVPAGATKPIHAHNSKPGYPLAAIGGTPGRPEKSVLDATASALIPGDAN